MYSCVRFYLYNFTMRASEIVNRTEGSVFLLYNEETVAALKEPSIWANQTM